LALGGDDAGDVELLSPQVATGLIDQIPSDSTVHRRHKELAHHDEKADGVGTMAVLAGMNTARTTAWASCGAANPAARATTTNPLVVDLDATEVLSHSDMNIRFTGVHRSRVRGRQAEDGFVGLGATRGALGGHHAYAPSAVCIGHTAEGASQWYERSER